MLSVPSICNGGGMDLWGEDEKECFGGEEDRHDEVL